ncbi:metal-dependent hydrolase [Halotalea alkalilenta]|uniref:Hydrolase n=1 Tax=Halotalea alkalilenta TaxID=376489 RepID=A0A172YA82_9GAMM|nr:metal-dependent hydrolase [Halotalea alkalilenta]ANF56129.1 hypothetical protein A5892_00500 [Halotalea alkalilenta]
MADFKTHLSAAAMTGAGLSTAGWYLGAWTLSEALALTGLVALGGILPDIDADRSHAVGLIFTMLAVIAMVAAVIALTPHMTLASLASTGIGVYTGVRYIASGLFRRLTVHRGVWHSLLAALASGFSISALGYHFFGSTAEQAWLQGAALCLGVVIHLLLDECYSVDMVGQRMKRSFGTALKLFDYQSPFSAMAMGVVIVCLLPWLPPWNGLFTLVDLLQGLWQYRWR